MFINLLDVTDSTLCDGILIPNTLFNTVHTIIRLIQIAVPVLLIIWGMLDFAKSVIAKKEEDVKKNRQNFFHRLIAAIIVFLMPFVVQFAVTLVSSVEDKVDENGTTVSDIWSCSKKFITGVKYNTEKE